MGGVESTVKHPQVALTASWLFDIERRVEASCQQPSLAGPPDLLRFQVWTLPRPSWTVVQPASGMSCNKNRKLVGNWQFNTCSGLSPQFFFFCHPQDSLLLYILLHFPFNQHTFKHRGTFLWNNLHDQYSKLFKKFLINQVVLDYLDLYWDQLHAIYPLSILDIYIFLYFFTLLLFFNRCCWG